MTDATPSGGSAPQREQPAAQTESAPVTGDAVKAEATTSGSMETSEKASEKSDDTVKAVTAVGGPVADVKKDEARLPDTEKKPAASKPDPATATAPKRKGQIAVFISRKDS